MKTRLIFSTIALAIAGWCNATDYPMLTLYADGCESANTIWCDAGQQVNVSAIPDEHRHFVRWTDGSTDNPRLLTVTQDMTLTAVFADDPILTLVSSNDNWGKVSGAGQFKPNSSCEISATANYGYHFTQWSDGNTDNPRTLILTQDTTCIAEFAANEYTIKAIPSESKYGKVSGSGTYKYQSEVLLTVKATNIYHHFSQWNDGNTDNPRTIIVTQDTTFTAEFAPNQYTIIASGEHGTIEGTGTFDYQTRICLTAIPDKGYHFVKWNNSKTSNPLCIYVVRTANYVATFAPNQYTITTYAQNGNVSGGGTYDYGTTATLTATADAHYHFTQWSDGNTDNPRTVAVEDNATYTAEFKPNSYTITVSAGEHGNVSGGGTYDYGTTATLRATADEHYHFTQWTDGNTDNPRLVTVTKDTTFTAEFADDPILTLTSSDDSRGYVYGGGQFKPNTSVEILAYPNWGYHFTQWTDGNTDNLRTIVLTCDTTFTAEFAQTFSGQCGDNLYWKYEGHTLTISGTGNMYDYNGNDMPWLLFRDTTDVVVLEQGITHIGNNAFNGFVKLNKIDLPSTLTSIGAGAFAGCRRLYDIYAYPTEPPVADNTSFANYNVNLYVPCDNLRDYQMDAVFGSFKYIQCMSTTDTEQVQTNITTDHAAEKVFRDGQVFILRGSKTYTLTGEEVE